MLFIKTAGWDRGVAELTKRLVDELSSGKRLLWLTSGGSNIQASAKIMSEIPKELTRQLSVMPIDERYGPVGHKDSNWAQLMQAGFNPQHATLMPVLTDGQEFTETARAYDAMAKKAFTDHDIVIAQCGMGDDGHVAGILPGSPATATNDKWACGYESPPYQRLTLTFQSLEHVTAIYTFAFGASKLPALQNLQDSELNLAHQPAQVLKQIPESYLYNDQLGDN